jgi:hypothetical protein
MENGELKRFQVQSFSIINSKILQWKTAFSNPHIAEKYSIKQECFFFKYDCYWNACLT